MSRDSSRHLKIEARKSEDRLMISSVLNACLAIGQFVTGIFAGSLALIADGLQNTNDAITLLLAWWAKRYGRLAPDLVHSYGHARIETIAAFGNLVSLALFAVFIVEDAIKRIFAPVQEVDGYLVVILSMVAVVINLITVLLLKRGSENSLNVRAAFLHNITDVLSSIAVLVSGVLIIMYKWYWVDTLLSLIIAFLMAYAMAREIKRVVNVLMDATPEDLSPLDVKEAILKIAGVERVVDFHMRRMNEDINAVEAHIIIDPEAMAINVKKTVKMMLYERFHVHHATVETSTRDEYILLKSVPHLHSLLDDDHSIPV
jgi:cobalt-zinc-cadmium efflux system protein